MEAVATESVKKKPLTRFGEIELLKAIAILCLPLVHVMEEAIENGYASAGLMDFGNAIIGLCAFGPSVFMICMGFGIGGGKSSSAAVARNGIQFLLIGGYLNFFRWFIPGLIQKFAIHTPLIKDINYCLQSDIYYFVGTYLVLYSFLKKRNVNAYGMLVISTLMCAFNTLMSPLTAKIPYEILRSLVGNLFYVDATSCFPLMSWAIFPSVGLMMGEVLKKADDEKRDVIMRRMLVGTAAFIVAFTVFLFEYKFDILRVLVSPLNDYVTDFPNMVLLIAVALLLISLAYYLCKEIGASPFMAFMLRISAFIMPFYLIQWLVIAWIFYALPIFGAPEGCFTLPLYLVTVAAVTAFDIFMTMRYGMKMMKRLLKITTFKKKKKKKKEA